VLPLKTGGKDFCEILKTNCIEKRAVKELSFEWLLIGEKLKR